jgi:hypothetical protein
VRIPSSQPRLCGYRAGLWDSTDVGRLPLRDSDPAWDSTDATRCTSYPHPIGYIPWTLLTGFGDFTDATRSYPEDSADEANK